MVGSVSATEQNDDLQITNDTDTVSTGEDAVTLNSNAVMAVNTENDAVIGIDDSGNTLQATDPRDELQTFINGHYGEEITLQKNYVFSSGTNNVGVNITGAITINGNGKTIDAAQTGRIFNITGENVIIKNLTLKNGKINQHGGLIYCDAKYLTVNHCNFYNSEIYSKGKMGGAIYYNQGYGTIAYCTFQDNNVTEMGGGAGAIYMTVGYMDISYSVFKKNTALTGDADGAAINSPAVKNVNVTHCQFESNAVLDCCWDLDFYSNSQYLYIYNCTFKNGYGEGSGDHDGASIVLQSCSDVVIDNCTWINNTARSGVAGGIYMRDKCSNVQITNSFFNNNTAREWGGAITIFPKATITNLIIKNNTFINNTAGYGGAISIQTTSSSMTIEDCKFYNNTATAQEGYSDDNTGNGGAIYVNCYTELKNCVFEGNKASVSGGAVYTTDVCLIKDSNFTSNNAVVYGGAIYDGTTDTSKTFAINNARFVNNHADNNGGALYIVDGATVSYDDLYYSGNTAPTNPDIKTDGVTILIKTMYVQVGKNGDGLSELTPTNWTYAFNNIANEGTLHLLGGAEYTVTGVTISRIITIVGDDDNVVFNANNQGRIFTVNIRDVTIKNIYFKNAYLAGSGAAISWSGTNGLLQDCTFDSCESYAASTNAIVSWAGENGVIDNCTFINNEATYTTDNPDAGAVWWSGNGGTIKNSNFTNNSAKNDGGAVLIYGSSITSMDIINCTFVENKADSTSGRGGAIAITVGTGVTVDSCNFTDNSATPGLGGAIYCQTVGGTVTNCNFNNNEAANGGAIYWIGTSGTVTNCNFTSNVATSNGGAIYWNVDGGSVTGSNFNNNEAVNGSAIYLSENVQTFEIKESSFVSNEASGYGTVAAKQLTTLSLGGNTFTSNTVSSGDNTYYFYDNTPSDISSSLVYVSESGSSTSLGLTSDNPTTWTHALSIIEENGKIVLLNEQFTNIVAQTIDKTIAIVGSGSTVLNGGGTKRFFTVTANGVTIENITFTNGNGDNGGAISWSGANGNLVNCTFTSNTATGNGGAVYWTGTGGSIDKSTFQTTASKNQLYTTQTLSVTNSVLQNQFTLTKTGNINYGVDEVISGTFTTNAPTSVTIYLNGESKGSVSVSSNSFSKTFSLLPVNTYTLSFKDNNNNSYTFSSSTSFTVSRIATVYISPGGGGSGASSSSPTTWDNVADIITSTGTIVFANGNYDLYGKSISNAWTLTASSASNVIINGNGQATIFSIDTTGVKIYNLTLINASKPITDSNVVTVKDSVLENQIEYNIGKSSYVYGETITITGSLNKISPSAVSAYGGNTLIGTSTGSTASYSISRNGEFAVGSYTLSATKKQEKRRIL